MDEKQLKHGAFGWFELMTTDIDGAKNFYSSLFDWKISDMPMEGMPYSVIKVGNEDVAGITTLPPDSGDMPPAWGIYITVDDVDQAAVKVSQQAGKVLVEPRDIPGIGRFSVIQDPQGAWLAVMTYKT